MKGLRVLIITYKLKINPPLDHIIPKFGGIKTINAIKYYNTFIIES
jgi:hypothetical protein